LGCDCFVHTSHLQFFQVMKPTKSKPVLKKFIS
jgi:hypothetical protein